MLVPLDLHDLGWSGAAIGGLFFATAALETAWNPLLGHLSDTRGRLFLLRFALLGSIAVSLALAWADTSVLLAALVVVAGLTYGTFYTPGMALISDRAEHAGIAQGLAFGVMNLGWAMGAAVGPAAGGALAQASGDVVPYLLLAGICLATLAYSQPRLRPFGSANSAERHCRVSGRIASYCRSKTRGYESSRCGGAPRNSSTRP